MAPARPAYAGKSEALAPGTVRETPEGWCVQTKALARWFGIGVKPMTAGSALMLQSDAKLPVELAMERQQRAAHIQPRQLRLVGLPQVRVPYRCGARPRSISSSAPASPIAPATACASIVRARSIAAGEIARLSL